MERIGKNSISFGRVAAPAVLGAAVALLVFAPAGYGYCDRVRLG